ncbi:hypothetical protein BXQ17_11720 [Polaribacter sp. BM10]|uniref:hypothetical protein n=1 Tax=Polaribacter sp. BM10 TaxID=1529069 RepID=UPI00098B4760|nr:hypothetical protein [Polaribacter sp. BM10]AQS94700.1 hypothetical protein BXQ17_11720 [Polaribacter sp. BM10]
MKTNYFFFILIFGMLFGACKQEEPLEKYMAKSWETNYLKIEMPTFENTDSLHVFEDKFDNNPIQVAQSKYNLDGTFTAWFLTNSNQKILETDGTWNVVGDSLQVSFFYNNKEMKVSYKITKTEEGFIGESKYDWDNDGVADDFLTMKTKEIKTE